MELKPYVLREAVASFISLVVCLFSLSFFS